MAETIIIDKKKVFRQNVHSDLASAVREKTRRAYDKTIKSYNHYKLDSSGTWVLYKPKYPLTAPRLKVNISEYLPIGSIYAAGENVDWPKILNALTVHYDVFEPGLMFAPMYAKDNYGWVIWKKV